MLVSHLTRQPPAIGRSRSTSRLRSSPILAWSSLLVLATAAPAVALDKQGSAHGGSVAGASEGIHVSGALMAGVSLYNPSYAARPDNTGRTLMRYAAHGDIDLVGRRLSVPIDLNVFTDRERDGASKLGPTELDAIVGLTSTWELGPGALEAGARFEHDRPVDRSGLSQTYVDVRTRYLYSITALFPGLGPALHGGDLGGWVTLGWFAHNPSYFARPDNTGLALFRYALHLELSVWDDLLSLGVDGTMFSDRQAPSPLRPSELDLTPELILRRRHFEIHLAYERDMPLDRSGLVQHFAYLLGVWTFSLDRGAPKPFEERGQILSP